MADNAQAARSSDPVIAAAQERGEQRAAIAAADRTTTAFNEEALRGEFGDADYYSGKRMLERYLQDAPAAEIDVIRNAGNGGSLNAEQLKTLAKRAMGDVPIGDAKAIEAELEEIRKTMREKPREYYASDRMQLRYRALLRAAGRA